MAGGADTLSQAEIDALLAAVAVEEPSDGPTEDADPYAGRVQVMDFRRPSKFNRDQLRTIEMLHETFARVCGTSLSSVLRSVTDISVLSAEQVTYGEFISSLPVPALTGIIDVEPLGTNAILAFDLPLVFSMLDRLLGGPGQGVARLRELTDIELQLSRNVTTVLLRDLSTAWSELQEMRFSLRGTEMNPQFAQIAPPTELSVLVSFQVTTGDQTGLMALCLPFRSIEAVAGRLTGNSFFGARAQSTTDALRSGLDVVSVEVRAEVGAVELTIGEVLALQPGDVVRLGTDVEDGIRLLAGPVAAYTGFPGAHRRRLSVQVNDRIATPTVEQLLDAADGIEG